MCLCETYNKVHVSKHLCDSFLIQNGRLLSQISNSALECAIRNGQENQVGLK
jgi:hypothetical protein